MDHLSKIGRSKVMAGIKSRDTGLERQLRRALWASGVRGYRIAPKGIPGRPDVCFTARKIAIFVNGCFWHVCPKCYLRPTTNVAFWRSKASENKNRDKRVQKELKSIGFGVIVIWEHTIKENLPRVIRFIKAQLRNRRR
jgi:DNA mismatch endonuclease (patch repair protein)